nr:PHD finger protein 7-like [Biomphalaria glabrata]
MSVHSKGISKRRRLVKRTTSIHCNTIGIDKKVCNFCESDENNELTLGAFHQKGDVTVHYFCMLLSSGLFQKTKISDKNSILGFLLPDIQNEIRRGKKLNCCFCNTKGATIGCCNGKCKKNFHLICGIQNGVLSQFFDNYRSYCADHRKTQSLVKTLSKGSSKKECAICLTSIEFTATSHYSLVCPSCKHCYFHKTCIQKYAISAGMHFFKCPLCNERETFQEEMLEFGIYIPDQDASWEREPDAFHDLLERHDSCDARYCRCPYGRKYDAEFGKYDLLLCGCCGSAGSHRACNGLFPKDNLFVCKDCLEILNTVNSNTQQCDTTKDQDALHLSCSSTQEKTTAGRATSRSRKRAHPADEVSGSSCYSQQIGIPACFKGKSSRCSPPKNSCVFVSGEMLYELKKIKSCPFCCFVLLRVDHQEHCISHREKNIETIRPPSPKKVKLKTHSVQDLDRCCLPPPPLIYMGDLNQAADNIIEEPPTLMAQNIS